MLPVSVIKSIFIFFLLVSKCYGLFNPNRDGHTLVQAFTPYYPNGDVNLNIVTQLAEFFAKRNLKNILIMGFDGEGPSLPLADRKALALAWNKEANRLKLNLLVEVGAMPFPDQVELAKFCSQLNVSAITAFPLLVYEADTEEDIIKDYQRLSDAAPNISLIYDAYTETEPRISPVKAFVSLMGQVKTFAGAIISMNNALDVKASVPSIYGYQLLIFGNSAVASAHASNMNGSLSNIPNLCPKLALDIEDLVYEGKIDLAFDLQQQISLLDQAIVGNNGQDIDFRSRSYFMYQRAAFEILTGMDLGARAPFNKATPAEFDRISCNLEEYEDLINCYCK